jgi:hypothetical protein
LASRDGRGQRPAGPGRTSGMSWPRMTRPSSSVSAGRHATAHRRHTLRRGANVPQRAGDGLWAAAGLWANDH